MQTELISDSAVDLARRFGGIERLYGAGSVAWLAGARVCVVGVGGVGSWVVEALARSGIGALCLIDLDNIAESNINRQAHALDATLGQAKVDAMAARVSGINPQCRVTTVEDFITPENVADLLRTGEFEIVVDAVDQVSAKLAMAAICRRQGVALVMAGGAGGKSDPRQIRADDLARTEQDPLLSRLRARLRREYGFPRDPGKKFGIEAVYSIEPPRPPVACAPRGLSCAGYGSSMMMTASLGLVIAERVVARLLRAGRDER
ncbi:MAG: tRNA threonylcarbamoyladenosine dehydratase [Azoarcus sp.]|jgi:tRNA A37 threonylcarbamoyladenosine dehydratase|nr:tRNA threonylcarbamoyladenosine dehydratase [Azoarcus sp.]